MRCGIPLGIAPPTWLVRLLGLHHGALRRPLDRTETAIRTVLLLLFVAAIPAAIAVGHWAGNATARQVRAAAATDHQVRAVLTQNAGANVDYGPYGSAQVDWAPARWTLPDGSTRSGDVPAPTSARRGDTVVAWTDATGAVTTAPGDHTTVVVDAGLAVAVTVVGSACLLLDAGLLAHWALERRRLAEWDAEWAVVGPRWRAGQR